MDWQIPLLVAVVVFVAYLVFKMRPTMSVDGRESAGALREAKKRVLSATTDPERAKALLDAADACARLGRTGNAVAYYLRALHLDPASKEVAPRAAASLGKRPAALEKVVWAKLGAVPWEGEQRAAAVEALRALSSAFGKRKRFRARQHAIDHALAALSVTEKS